MGCLTFQAEIIPIYAKNVWRKEPDPDNAGVGKLNLLLT